MIYKLTLIMYVLINFKKFFYRATVHVGSSKRFLEETFSTCRFGSGITILRCSLLCPLLVTSGGSMP